MGRPRSNICRPRDKMLIESMKRGAVHLLGINDDLIRALARKLLSRVGYDVRHHTDILAFLSNSR